MGSATTDDAVTSSKLHIGSLHVSDWRLFLLLCSIPGFLSAILILFIPETPAYLYHVSQALKTIIIIIVLVIIISKRNSRLWRML